MFGILPRVALCPPSSSDAAAPVLPVHPVLHTLYVDMNSYFASVEQQLRPELRGRPVAVVPVEADTTSVIAASYEAKAFGVKTGVRVGDARRMCPGLVLAQARTDEYVRFHHAILAAIDTVIPVQGVHSIDEVSCKLLREQRDEPVARDVATRIKKAIATRVGAFVKCSIGIGPNRLIAKIAADMKKPDGLTVVHKAELPHRLFTLKPIDLPGIGPKMNERLRRAGITTVERLCEQSELDLGRLWGSVVGREWFYRLRGDAIYEESTARRTIGHSHVLSPQKRNEEAARGVAVRLLTKVATRARHMGYVADDLSVGVRYLTPRAKDGGSPATCGHPPHWHAHAKVGGLNDTTTLLRVFSSLWDQKPVGPMLQVSVRLYNLAAPTNTTGLLFAEPAELGRLSQAMDTINKRYGADVLYPASMQNARKSAPRRIAFGNIPDLDVPDVTD